MNSIINDLYTGDLCPCKPFKSILQHYYDKKEEAFYGYEAFIKKFDE